MSTNQKTKNWYNENATEYASHVKNSNQSIYHHYYEKPAMYKLLPNLKGKTVLSVGCGSGEDSNYLLKKGAKKSVGIDLSKELIKIAKMNHPECDFYEMNMEKINFPEKSFDFVYSSLAIHYVKDWSKVFKKINKILKSKSYFLFSCHHPVKAAMEDVSNEEEYISRLEISKNKKTNKRKIVGDYLAKKKIINAFGKDTVDLWGRSLGEISEVAFKNGFLIEKIVEPKPLEKMKEIDLADYEKLKKVPEFIIFKLIKKD